MLTKKPTKLLVTTFNARENWYSLPAAKLHCLKLNFNGMFIVVEFGAITILDFSIIFSHANHILPKKTCNTTSFRRDYN